MAACDRPDGLVAIAVAAVSWAGTGRMTVIAAIRRSSSSPGCPWSSSRWCGLVVDAPFAVVEVGVAAWIAGRWITPLRNRLAAGLPIVAGAAPVARRGPRVGRVPLSGLTCLWPAAEDGGAGVTAATRHRGEAWVMAVVRMAAVGETVLGEG